jgi:hypothetical protein
VVDVTDPLSPFFTSPDNKTPLTPASFASGQPSPSESKSKPFGIPSLSSSQDGGTMTPKSPVINVWPITTCPI